MDRILIELMDRPACQRVHEATLKLLAEVGVDVKHKEARALLSSSGAVVDGERVRLAGELVEEALATVEHSTVVEGRGGDGAIVLENGRTYYGTGSDVLYYHDPVERRRRRVRLADVEDMASLCERLPNMDFVMSMGLPEDVPQVVDDLAPFAAMLKGTRKPLLVATRTAHFFSRMLEMADLCGAAKSFAIYGMPAPPLKHDYEAVEKLLGCARLGIPIVYGPVPNPGTTGPCSLAGVNLVGNAEVLSGLVISQLAAPGASFVYGANAVGMDMRTGAASYCVPEMYANQLLGCDMARYYGLPSFGYGGCSDSKLLDEQCSLEAGLTLALAALSGCTLLHDVGYLEAGLQSSCESIVLGDELIGFVDSALQHVASGEEELELALEEVRAIGPGGHFLGRPLTRKNVRTWWHPALLDQTVFDRWQAQGGRTLGQRAHERAMDLRGQEPVFVLDIRTQGKLDRMVEEAATAAIS